MGLRRLSVKCAMARMMSQTTILPTGMVLLLVFLLCVRPETNFAQATPCDNSGAESVFPTDGQGQPMTPRDINADAEVMKEFVEARLKEEDIRRCLLSNEPLVNHIIDFDQYSAAWNGSSKKRQGQDLRIQGSVLWSFRENGVVDLALLARINTEKDGEVTHTIDFPIEFTNVAMGPSTSAARVTFLAKINFGHSSFGNMANFSGANFSDATFDDGFVDTGFAGATFGDDASFSGATFGDNAAFFDAVFGDGADFTNSIFGDRARFSGAIFGDGARFISATFGNYANFSHATFRDASPDSYDLQMDGASFAAGTFGDNANFFGITFHSLAAFQWTTFGDYASFTDSKFHRQALFYDARFGNHAGFSEAKFHKLGAFSLAVFRGDANFRQATAYRLGLADTVWQGRVDFRESQIEVFDWDSNQVPSTVKGIFDAREATFGSVSIRDVYFSDLADFSDAELGVTGGKSTLAFENVIFDKAADFLRTKFRHDAIFVRNRFRGLWDLTSAAFRKKETGENTHLCLSFNRISRLRVQRRLLYDTRTKHLFQSLRLFLFPSIGDSLIRGVRIRDSQKSCADLRNSSASNNGDRSFRGNEELSAIYTTISSSFRAVNDKWGENEAWYLGMVAGREDTISQMKRWPPRWVPWILLDVPSRYGIDLYRVILVSTALMLLFTPIYWGYFRLIVNSESVKLAPISEQRRVLRFRPLEQYFAVTEARERQLLPFRDGLFLSGRVFVQLGLGTLYPRRPWLVFVATVEWLIGLFMLIHFLLAVKNTLPIALPFLGG